MQAESLLIVIPSFNDWASLSLLLPRVEQALSGSKWKVSILIVDDASTEIAPDNWLGAEHLGVTSVSVLHLRSNQGHQRAIALGLYHAHEFTDADTVVVMDGDGEDRAEDIPALLAEFERGARRAAVFAARTRRMESATFQISYQAFRVIHRILTGVEVRVGNFSVLPRSILLRLMTVPDVWNHYAAAVYRARFPRRLVPLPRGRRLEGRSRMNYVSLLIHGLSAMSVFSDQISARLLAASAGLVVASIGFVCWQGWTPASIAVLALAAQSVTFSALFALTIVSRRNAMNFSLLRDASVFILGMTKVVGSGFTTGFSAPNDLQAMGESITEAANELVHE
jgi:hypothetical protein